MAMPKPLTDDTENAPMMEQMAIYTRMLVGPFFGATTKIRTRDVTTAATANVMNPVGKKKQKKK